MPETGVDPAPAKRVLARFLDDLVIFEGSEFIATRELDLSDAPAWSAATAAANAAAASAPSAATLDQFRQQICTCTRCPLGQTRQNFVFGSGNPDAGIMFIGEAPGAEEDRRGEPFVGAAGQLLSKIIAAMKMRREDVFICNVLKCRPPGNRDPLPEEVGECEPYLKKQIEIIGPKIICTLGRVASHAVLKTTASMRSLRGVLHEYEGIPVIVSYHPAALLRNAGLKRDTWDDMRWLRRQYDGVEL